MSINQNGFFLALQFCCCIPRRTRVHKPREDYVLRCEFHSAWPRSSYSRLLLDCFSVLWIYVHEHGSPEACVPKNAAGLRFFPKVFGRMETITSSEKMVAPRFSSLKCPHNSDQMRPKE